MLHAQMPRQNAHPRQTNSASDAFVWGNSVHTLTFHRRNGSIRLLPGDYVPALIILAMLIIYEVVWKYLKKKSSS